MVLTNPENFQAIGISVQNAPIATLESIALASEEVRKVHQVLRSNSRVSGAVVLSTCNRTELYIEGDSRGSLSLLGYEALQNVVGYRGAHLRENKFYHYQGRDGCRHLLKVACGLDSMMLGETQILGQLKQAFEISREFWKPRTLDKVFEGALRVAAKSRSDTKIGLGAVSVASVAVHLASRVFSDIEEQRILVVGAGETGKLVAQHFAKRGPKTLKVLNRTIHRAEAVANVCGAKFGGLEEIVSSLQEADVAVFALSSPSPVLSRKDFHDLLAMRAGRPLLLIDLGIPRNLGSGPESFLNVFVHNIEDLRHVVDANYKERKKAIPQVEDLIEIELNHLERMGRAISAGPAIRALRTSIERTGQAELMRYREELSAKELETVERIIKSISNKLLHGPSMALKDYAEKTNEATDVLEAIRVMFEDTEDR
ncbi:MAG: glutamyl-tRNA reductase [Myxococcota bacterium]|nr:glutamyl-tRNA reductase [Myxococcota bacterium]